MNSLFTDAYTDSEAKGMVDCFLKQFFNNDNADDKAGPSGERSAQLTQSDYNAILAQIAQSLAESNPSKIDANVDSNAFNLANLLEAGPPEPIRVLLAGLESQSESDFDEQEPNGSSNRVGSSEDEGDLVVDIKDGDKLGGADRLKLGDEGQSSNKIPAQKNIPGNTGTKVDVGEHFGASPAPHPQAPTTPSGEVIQPPQAPAPEIPATPQVPAAPHAPSTPTPETSFPAQHPETPTGGDNNRKGGDDDDDGNSEDVEIDVGEKSADSPAQIPPSTPSAPVITDNDRQGPSGADVKVDESQRDAGSMPISEDPKNNGRTPPFVSPNNASNNRKPSSDGLDVVVEEKGTESNGRVPESAQRVGGNKEEPGTSQSLVVAELNNPDTLAQPQSSARIGEEDQSPGFEAPGLPLKMDKTFQNTNMPDAPPCTPCATGQNRVNAEEHGSANRQGSAIADGQPLIGTNLDRTDTVAGTLLTATVNTGKGLRLNRNEKIGNLEQSNVRRRWFW